MTFPSSPDLAKNVSVFYCPSNPKFKWILSDPTPFYIASTTSSFASPATVFVNILVIIAVWKTRELQTNSNILLASMAAADLLVGVASMPLTITLDILLLRKTLSLTICKIAFVNQLVLYGAVSSSLYHLTVVAWERYVAIERCLQYNVIVRRARVKKFAITAWVLAVLTTTPVLLLTATGVQNNFISVLNVILSLPALVCMILIGYFYARVYQGVRQKLKLTQQISCAVRVRARHENGIAKRTTVITAFTFVYFIPSVVVLLFGKAAPFLRTSSFFRWSVLIIQLNSLMNPILYCFALNRHFRNVILTMMKIKKTNADQMAKCLPVASFKQRRSRQISATEMVNFQEFKEEQLLSDLIARAGPQDSNSTAFPAVCQSHAIFNSQPLTREAMAAPSCKANGSICVDVHQPKRKRRPEHGRIKPTSPQTEERRDQSLPNSISKQAMERSMPSTSCQVNSTPSIDEQQSAPMQDKSSRQKKTTKNVSCGTALAYIKECGD